LSATSSSWQFQKGVSSSPLYVSQNWDLEDELYQEDSLVKVYKNMEKEEVQQPSKGVEVNFTNNSG
jgi:hypothetical protein